MKYEDDTNAPYTYYSPYGDQWYVDEEGSIRQVDVEGNQELYYEDGDYVYFGTDGTY